MSRNADDDYKQYQELYNMGIELVFLKEPYINTATYRSSVKQQEDAAQAAAQANKCSNEDTAAFVGGLMILLNNYICISQTVASRAAVPKIKLMIAQLRQTTKLSSRFGG